MPTQLAVMGVLLGVLELSAAEHQGAAGDAEIRVTRLASSVETTLTLVLHGSRGDLPVNLVFRAVHEDRPRLDRPSELGLMFVMSPVFGGPLDLKPPHLVLIVDEGLSGADILTRTVVDEPLFNVGPSDVFELRDFDFDTLARFDGATSIRGRLFNLEFAMTPEQVRSIGEFGRRIQQRPR